MSEPRASESIAFANQFRRELTRLEKLHAHNITPGSTEWIAALRAVFRRMDKAGSPIKQSAILKNLITYVREIKPEEKTAFALAQYHSKRVAALSVATLDFGPHPLTGPDEDGVHVSKTVITLKRDGDSAMSSAPLVYASQHAIERMHQRRAHPLDIKRAMRTISSLGMLGAMISLDACGHEAMCLNIDNELLAVGDIRHAVGPANEDGRRAYSAMYDVRSFLCIGELESWDKRLAQGNAAVAAINAWASDKYGDAEAFVKSIPVLAQQRETYTAQTAKKLTA